MRKTAGERVETGCVGASFVRYTRPMHRLRISIALLVAAPAALAAQTVSGTVLDAATKRPIPGVTVTVRSSRDSVTLRAGVSDTAGRFRLVLPIADTVFVTVRRIGLEPVETPPRAVDLGVERQFTFNMSPSPIMLDTVRTEITKAMTGLWYKLTSGQEWFARHYRDGKGFFTSGTEVKLSGLHPCDYFAGLPGLDMGSAIVRGVQAISCFEGGTQTTPVRFVMAERHANCIEAYVDRRFHLVAAANQQLGVMMPGYETIRWISLSSIEGIEVFTRYEDRPRDFSFVQSPRPQTVDSRSGWIPVPGTAAAPSRGTGGTPERCVLILVWTSQLWG
jgi:hypothetical protein